MRLHALLAVVLTAASVACALDVPVEVRLLDSQSPGPNVTITWSANDILKGTGKTDPTGRYTIPNLPDSITWLNARASADGMVSVSHHWVASPTSPPAPPPFNLLLEKSTRIAGRVVDDAGRPVPGATVEVGVRKKYPGSSQRFDRPSRTTKTDADGLFSFDGLPANPDQVSLAAFHPLHITSEYIHTTPFSPRESLWDGTAKLTLPTCAPVEITVLNPDGNPAPGAKVFIGNDNQVSNCLPLQTAGADGVLRIAAKPGLSTTLTATLDGFGPAQAPLSVQTDPQRLTLKLTPPHPRTIDVVDADGNPIAGATVRPATWRRSQVLSAELRTDAAGHAAWNAGPADPVDTDIRATGYTGKDRFAWTPGSLARVVLLRPTPVTARILDAQTNQPITNFTVRTAVVWNEGERLVWQFSDFLTGQLKKSPGQFHVTLSRPAARYLLRVYAPGYLPEDIGPFAPDGKPKNLDLRLTHAPDIALRVLTPDDRPVPGADVYLVTASDWMGTNNGRPREGSETNGIHARTDAAGRFSLPPQKEDFALLILSDQGSATLKRQDLTSPDAPIRLTPWATVRGTIDLQGKPAANLTVYGYADPTTLADGKPIIAPQYFFTTDKDGSFSLPRVPAGRLVLTRSIPNHAPGRFWYVSLDAIDAQPGQDMEVHLGRGAAVTGKLLIPDGKPWMIRQARLQPKGQSDDVNNVEVLDDGRFRAEGLAPGDYTLHVALHEFPPDNACGWGRLVGEFDKTLTIPPAAQSHDVGAISASPTTGRALDVGDAAPDFTVQTLDGRSLRLADLKGKFILLDFWATWCAPCIAELPNMKALAAAQANNPDFLLLSLSIDDDTDRLRRFLAHDPPPWPQAHLDIESPTVRAYGATAVPLTILIGPDGRILARDLRGAELQSAVETALRSRTQAK